MIKKNNFKKGYLLFFASLVSIVILIISYFILGIITRQFSNLQNLGQSQRAFYAAESLAECLSYHSDNTNDLLSYSEFLNSGSHSDVIADFANEVPELFNGVFICDNQAIDVGKIEVANLDISADYYELKFNNIEFYNSELCANATISVALDDLKKKISIRSTGLSNCEAGNSGKVERGYQKNITYNLSNFELIARVGWYDQRNQASIENGVADGDTINNTGSVTRNSSGELVWNTGDAKQFLSLENQSIEEGESVVLIGRFARGLDETYPNLFSIAVGTNNSQIVLFVIEPDVSVVWLGNNGAIIGAVNNSLVAVGDYYIGALQVTRTATGIDIMAADNGVSNLTPKPYSTTRIPFSTSNITFNIGGRDNSSDQSWDGKIKDVIIIKRATPYTENELSNLTPDDF